MASSASSAVPPPSRRAAARVQATPVSCSSARSTSRAAMYASMWLKVRKSMSWGSGAPSRPTGAFTPVCTWEIQSNRMDRILVFTAVCEDGGCAGGRSSSRKTAHLAVDRMACLLRSPMGLSHRSSSSSVTFVASAAARAQAPASPMLLFGSERRRSTEPGALSTAAMIFAPSSPIWLLPRHSSPSEAFCGIENAMATARAPCRRSPRPLSSSSKR
mmetsp:Transcript_87541/g.225499  ORF Transcript_87541/g.225499 Transcript_87541/m.225499 type:complete len:216 (+) Transcript_87541:398-1045(+)